MSADPVDVLIIRVGAYGAAVWSLPGTLMKAICLEQGTWMTGAATSYQQLLFQPPAVRDNEQF